MEDFVTFEIAKKLKEKRFKDNCIGYYDYEGEFHHNYESAISNEEIYFCHNKYDNIWHRDLVDAPTISQVLKWLREEKDIFIELEYINQEDCGCTIILQETGGLIAKWNWDKFQYANKNPLVRNTYEKTALAGIEYVIDNLF